MQTIGFDRSYIRFRIDQKLQSPITVTHAMPTTVNNVRINVECRCEVIELASERSRVYLLGASCKTERVGASSDCWLQPNADFCLVASEEEFLTIKSWASNDIKNEKLPGVAGIPLERQSGLSRDAWPEFRLQVKAAHGRPLTSVEAIIAAIQGDRPLVARTEFTQDRYRVIIDQHLDGRVDAADYSIWRDAFGLANESSLNGNGDGMNGVDEGDYLLWKSQFGATLGGAGQLGTHSVPEPTSGFLLGSIAVCAVATWRLGRRWASGSAGCSYL
jgi:hypothetical protein